MDFVCRDWEAIQNDMPGPGDETTLTITGTCGRFPKDGYDLELVELIGGINPFEPIFNLVVHEPTSGATVMSDETVEHIKTVGRGDPYAGVTIMYEGKALARMDVKHRS
jgi:hypothetical protein